MPAQESSNVVQIGEWMVHPALDSISRGIETQKLEPRAMRLLLCLANSAGEVVSIDRLLSEVWAGVVVGSASVYEAVSNLRKILGDVDPKPTYIVTVPRKGYRLIASVKRSAAPSETPQVSAPQRRTVGQRRALIVAGVMVLALTAAYFSTRTMLGRNRIVVSDKSIAVLPFADMSEKKDQGYFADGMAEELISSLAKLPELRVPARTSSFYFKGRQATVADIARSLGVEYVLEGSVRKSGTMLRTTVELVRASSGYHVWSQTYDRELRDVFKVQDEIAMAVVKALKISLLGRSIPGEAPAVNPEAYALYLQARFLERRDASGDYVPAVTYLKKALDIDPTFSLAWAELALAHTIFFDTFTSVPAKEIRREAVESANKALTLNPNLPEAHLAMAKIFSHIDWDWSGAESEFNRVLELDSANSDALLGLAKIAAMNGRLDQTLELCQRVIAQDPLNDLAYFSLAGLQSRRGDYKQAEVARRKVLELNPTGATGHFWLGYALLAQGKPTEALEEMQKEEDATIRKDGTVLALDALGHTKEAELLVAELERNPESASANIAAFYACRKDADRAFVWLERAYVLRDYYITGIGADFCFNKLRTDARYKAFLRKMKLTE